MIGSWNGPPVGTAHQRPDWERAIDGTTSRRQRALPISPPSALEFRVLAIQSEVPRVPSGRKRAGQMKRQRRPEAPEAPAPPLDEALTRVLAGYGASAAQIARLRSGDLDLIGDRVLVRYRQDEGEGGHLESLLEMTESAMLMIHMIETGNIGMPERLIFEPPPAPALR